MEIISVPKFNGLITRITPTTYMLNLDWMAESGGSSLRLSGFRDFPDAKDLQLQPFNCMTQTVKDGIYSLRMFFYYRSEKSFSEFPIVLVFQANGSETDAEGYPVINRQVVPANFLVV